MHDHYSDALIRSVLADVRTIAVVGASANPVRPSFMVSRYLAGRGYRVFPVNPGHGGGEIAGLAAYTRLADIPEPIDMIDVFRASQHVAAVLDEALALSPLPKVLWTQLGVRDEASAVRAEAAGLTVVMDRCPKIEFGRLSGEIGWAGINSRVISTKRPLRSPDGVQKLAVRRLD